MGRMSGGFKSSSRENPKGEEEGGRKPTSECGNKITAGSYRADMQASGYILLFKSRGDFNLIPPPLFFLLINSYSGPMVPKSLSFHGMFAGKILLGEWKGMFLESDL